MATVAPGRVICNQCGANNFETQAACWKCSGPLGNARPNAAIRDPALSPNAPAVAISPLPSTVDPSVAHWVGIIGGLLLPLFMLPVGLIFLMWDDKRKVEIGRTATIASLIGSVLQAIFTYFAVAGLVMTAMKMMPGAVDKAKSSSSEPAPDYNGAAKPLELPGIPPMVPAK